MLTAEEWGAILRHARLVQRAAAILRTLARSHLEANLAQSTADVSAAWKMMQRHADAIAQVLHDSEESEVRRRVRDLEQKRKEGQL